VAVLGLIPGEECLAEGPGVLQGAEALAGPPGRSPRLDRLIHPGPSDRRARVRANSFAEVSGGRARVRANTFAEISAVEDSTVLPQFAGSHALFDIPIESRIRLMTHLCHVSFTGFQ